ncbi:MAG: ribosome recycling factor [Chloroflexota bacterium]|nr:ribosome recycling factor [Chloroflexota bacterium]MCY3638363.1 ribosome recycling factor [Chloroflexota bacterium]MDE2687565.1 ribosome recycling factor [Chloroflexota bacterium]MYC07388.1 ribosome recycling factor [Chloroflexota bacterium]
MATAEDVLLETDDRMQKSVDALKRELNTIRTGRASPALVETLTVEYYGIPTPMNQLASISVPEARVLMIQPWDKQSIKDVERSILMSDLGLTPNNDGTAIRLNLPVLTEERRRELVRLVGRKVEDGLVSIRNIRRDSLGEFRAMERNKEISQDESRYMQEELQEITNAFSSQMQEMKQEKEAEVMEV